MCIRDRERSAWGPLGRNIILNLCVKDEGGKVNYTKLLSSSDVACKQELQCKKYVENLCLIGDISVKYHQQTKSLCLKENNHDKLRSQQSRTESPFLPSSAFKWACSTLNGSK